FALMCLLVLAAVLILFFFSFSFFFPNMATTEIYTLSLHDALPIFFGVGVDGAGFAHGAGVFGVVVDHHRRADGAVVVDPLHVHQDRKSTRLNSSHVSISYAVFCLKKKK